MDDINALKAENEKIKNILYKLFPEKSGHYFISGQNGSIDIDGLPDYIHITPEYGCDFVVAYKKMDANTKKPLT